MLGAVIFDFDGVITDSEIMHLRAFNRVLAQFNLEIAKEDYYRDYLGLTDADLFKILAEKYPVKIEADNIETLMSEKEKVFAELAETDGSIIEGVRDVLQLLEQNRIPTAICSGALLVEIKMILADAGLDHFFKVIIAADHVRKGKPDPEGFVLALKKLNEQSDKLLTSGQCIVIEDSHWGLIAAKAAGMHTVAVTNSYGAEQLKMADKIVDRLDHLTLADLQQLCG